MDEGRNLGECASSGVATDRTRADHDVDWYIANLKASTRLNSPARMCYRSRVFDVFTAVSIDIASFKHIIGLRPVWYAP